MATYSVNGTSLVARARDRADMPGVKFIPDSTFLQYVNDELAKLYWEIVQYDEDYYTTSTALTLTNGVQTYALPDDYSKMRGLDVPLGGQQYKYTGARLEWQERNDLQGPFPSIVAGTPVRWQVYGRTIRLFPLPGGTFACTLWYIPQAPILALASTPVWNCEPGWENYIIDGAAGKALRKEESFEAADRCVAAQAETLALIAKTLRRDQSGPKKIARRRYRNNLWWPFARPY